MMRASIRKQSAGIIKAAKAAGAGLSDHLDSPHIQSIIRLVAETLEAITSLRAVSWPAIMHGSGRPGHQALSCIASLIADMLGASHPCGRSAG